MDSNALHQYWQAGKQEVLLRPDAPYLQVQASMNAQVADIKADDTLDLQEACQGHC